MFFTEISIIIYFIELDNILNRDIKTQNNLTENTSLINNV